MKGLFQSILTFAGILRPKLPRMDESSFPSLPFDHLTSIQLSAWLVALNTGDIEYYLPTISRISLTTSQGTIFEGSKMSSNLRR